MKYNFTKVLDLVLVYEGGYVNNPRDPGGPTNLGVTQVTLSHELGHPASIMEVRALTPAQVAPIYQKKYWNLIGGDVLPSGVDLIAMDYAVNSGPGRVLPLLAQTTGFTPLARIKYIDYKRRGFWHQLRTFVTFGRGWLNRENNVYAHAIVMVGE